MPKTRNHGTELGKKYGQLLVVGPREGPNWRCKCTCGNYKFIAQMSLRAGLTNSCGCLHKKNLVERVTTHGMYDTREYHSYTSMKSRCYNTKNSRYSSHGGRGIVVCERWLESFENFYADMGPRPTNTSLDREDNDGNYTPGNCRWATPTEQASNTKQAKLYTLNGITDTQAGWSRRQAITPQLVSKRLARGKTIEQALGFKD